jgi:hypothetical protein
MIFFTTIIIKKGVGLRRSSYWLGCEGGGGGDIAANAWDV